MEKLNLKIKEFMDFPMILNTLDTIPEEINLTLEDMNKNLILDTLKYLMKFSKENDVKVNLIDEDHILG